MLGARVKGLAKCCFMQKRQISWHCFSWNMWPWASLSIHLLTLGCLGSVSSVTSRPSQLLRSLARARCVGPRPSASTCTRALPRFTRPPSAMRENVNIWYHTKTDNQSKDKSAMIQKSNLILKLYYSNSFLFIALCSLPSPGLENVNDVQIILPELGASDPILIPSMFFNVLCNPATCPTARSRSSFVSIFSFIADSYLVFSWRKVGS